MFNLIAGLVLLMLGAINIYWGADLMADKNCRHKRPLPLSFLPNGTYLTGWLNDELIITDENNTKVVAVFVRKPEDAK